MSEVKSWTIKDFPLDVRELADCARAHTDQTQAEWVADAVRALAERQSTNAVIPPSRPSPPDPTPAEIAKMGHVDMAGLGAALQAIVVAAQASGAAVPKALPREAAALARNYMRAVQGLPPRQTGRKKGQTAVLTLSAPSGPPDGQTSPRNGQTDPLPEFNPHPKG